MHKMKRRRGEANPVSLSALAEILIAGGVPEALLQLLRGAEISCISCNPATFFADELCSSDHAFVIVEGHPKIPYVFQEAEVFIVTPVGHICVRVVNSAVSVQLLFHRSLSFAGTNEKVERGPLHPTATLSRPSRASEAKAFRERRDSFRLQPPGRSSCI